MTSTLFLLCWSNTVYKIFLSAQAGIDLFSLDGGNWILFADSFFIQYLRGLPFLWGKGTNTSEFALFDAVESSFFWTLIKAKLTSLLDGSTVPAQNTAAPSLVSVFRKYLRLVRLGWWFPFPKWLLVSSGFMLFSCTWWPLGVACVPSSETVWSLWISSVDAGVGNVLPSDSPWGIVSDLALFASSWLLALFSVLFSLDLKWFFESFVCFCLDLEFGTRRSLWRGALPTKSLPFTGLSPSTSDSNHRCIKLDINVSLSW